MLEYLLCMGVVTMCHGSSGIEKVNEHLSSDQWMLHM